MNSEIMPTKHTERISRYTSDLTIKEETNLPSEQGYIRTHSYIAKFEITVSLTALDRFDPMIKYARRLLVQENHGPTSEINSMASNYRHFGLSVFVLRGLLRWGNSAEDISHNAWMISTIRRIGEKVERKFFQSPAAAPLKQSVRPT